MKDNPREVSKSYHKLILWHKLKELLLITYRLTNSLPKSEEFGLKSQMNRAIVSVLSNFIEGYLKSSKKEKIHYLEISTTSLLELEAQSEICHVLGFWSDKDLDEFEEKRRIAAYFLGRYRSRVVT
jgi:four helix bundle protein